MKGRFIVAVSATGLGLSLIVLQATSPELVPGTPMRAGAFVLQSTLAYATEPVIVDEFDLDTSVLYPQSACVRDSFNIIVRARVNQVKRILALPSLPPQKTAYSKADASNRRSFLMENDLVAGVLELPGLDYDATPRRLSDGETSWTVRASKPGHYAGRITLVPASSPISSEALRFRARAAAIAIDVTEEPLDAKKLFGAFVYVLGSLLTLPGLILFWREYVEWRDKREHVERASVEEKKKNLIILP